MKTIRILGIGLLVVFAVMADLAWAASRYTDKDNALKLAEALDKGVYHQKLITSTFVQSEDKDKYYIKAILENGAEHNWDIRELRGMARDGDLVLRNNQALIFPDETENSFVILDKNLFSQRALQSKVYIKLHPDSDVLAGQEIAFGIHRFNLAGLLGIQSTRDDQGYKHQYVLDLENGQRELLSLLDAYQVLDRNGLRTGTSGMDVLRTPYRLREIRTHGLTETGQLGVGQFGVEVVFDRPVILQPNHFPYRFFENGNDSSSRDKFVVEVTLPNAELAGRIRPIKVLEYLHEVRAVTDPTYSKRLLMRANISPDVMTLPPRVDVRGNSVLISFAKVVDLTAEDRRTLHDRDLLTRQERLLNQELSSEELQRRQTYGEQMTEGTRLETLSRKSETILNRIDMLVAAMESYTIAAENASTDLQLKQALHRRNILVVRIPKMTITYTRKELSRKRVSGGAELRQVLEKVATLTRDRVMLNTIQELLANPELR